MKKIIIVLLVLIYVNVYSQGEMSVFNGLNNKSSTFIFKDLNIKTASNIEGSIYLFDGWSNKGVVYSIEDKGYKLSNINLNIKDNSIDVNYSDKTNDSIFSFNNHTVKRVVINNKNFVKKTIKNEDFDKNIFLEELKTRGEIKLYKSYSVSFKKGSFNPMTQKKITNDKYVQNIKYYIEKNNLNLEYIKLKKKLIFKYLGNKKNKLKDFIKTNKMKMKKESEFIRLLNYYNSI